MRKPPDVAQAGKLECAIIDLRSVYEANSITRKQNTAEVFAIVVANHPDVPWPSGFSELAANQPGGGLHVDVLLHLAQEPFFRSQIAPQRTRNKLRPARAIHEMSPGRRQKGARTQSLQH